MQQHIIWVGRMDQNIIVSASGYQSQFTKK